MVCLPATRGCRAEDFPGNYSSIADALIQTFEFACAKGSETSRQANLEECETPTQAALDVRNLGPDTAV